MHILATPMFLSHIQFGVGVSFLIEKNLSTVYRVRCTAFCLPRYFCYATYGHLGTQGDATLHTCCSWSTRLSPHCAQVTLRFWQTSWWLSKSFFGTIAEQRFGHGHSAYRQSLFTWFYSISKTPREQSALEYCVESSAKLNCRVSKENIYNLVFMFHCYFASIFYSIAVVFYIVNFRCSQWLSKTTRRCCGVFAIPAPRYKWLYLLTYLLILFSLLHFSPCDMYFCHNSLKYLLT